MHWDLHIPISPRGHNFPTSWCHFGSRQSGKSAKDVNKAAENHYNLPLGIFPAPEKWVSKLFEYLPFLYPVPVPVECEVFCKISYEPLFPLPDPMSVNKPLLSLILRSRAIIISKILYMHWFVELLRTIRLFKLIFPFFKIMGRSWSSSFRIRANLSSECDCHRNRNSEKSYSSRFVFLMMHTFV